MLYRALEAQARARLDARRAEVASLKTADAIRERETRIRAKFLQALGDLPDRTPLNARVVGSVPRDGYQIERVIYESRPGHFVTASFYRPAGQGPFPGVLLPCGHSENGKAAETYQRAAALLATNGLATLCFDPIGQGERVQALDPSGRPAIKGSTTEHTMAGVGALLVGRSAAGYRVWDAIRSLDYLASRPEVDATRLGCTGNSGGGTETAYIMALDDRVAAAAPSCYVTSLARLFATIGPQDAEQNITGQVAFGMDHADFALMRAPKPTLLCVGTRDFFDINGSWDTFRELKLAYGRFGYGERVDLFESDEPHGFTKPRREAAVRWLRRWLLKKDEPTVETEGPLIPDAQLLCTKTGQVLTDLHGSSVFDMNARRAAELVSERTAYLAAHSPEERLAEVRRLIALPGTIKPARSESRGTVERPGYTVRKLLFTTETGIAVPALRFDSKADSARKAERGLTILATDRTFDDLVRGGPEGWSAAQGRPLLAVSLRGLGETAPETKPAPSGAAWKEAFLALHLARPLLGQRVFDLLAIVTATSAEFGGDVDLVGQGQAAPAAVHAAALDARIKSLVLEDIVTSWTDVAGTVIARDQIANVVPGVLARYDLPELVGAIAPRRVTIRSVVSPNGLPVAREKAAAAYEPAARAYREKRAEGAFTLAGAPARPTLAALLTTADLSLGEQAAITLSDGSTATVKLVSLNEPRDPVRHAVREPVVTLEVNGRPVTLVSGNYHLPVPAGGVQVDCSVTRGYLSDSQGDPWQLKKDARVRLWPARSPWIEPDAFAYPLRQRWFASNTQMANEPVFVDGGEKPLAKAVYYHYGLDSGGAEGHVDVVAATDGLVVSAGTARLAGFEDSPARPRYDVVYLLDDRGWFYRYSHLQTIDPAIKPGASVRIGQTIGLLGKEGGSGGWSHLHFDITSRQPSGHWGIQEGYAFLWQAMLREQKPDVVAVARPHRLTWAGESVTIDASKSWARSGPLTYEWTLSDGTSARGPKIERTYDHPGAYSEVLKVTDRQGRVDYDFAVVQVLDREHPDRLPPTIHAAFSPTFAIKPGDPVTFKVRTFRTTDGHETWDFGDGSAPVDVHSDGNASQHAKDGYAITEHRFTKPGHYVVRVSRSNAIGDTATGHLHVVVAEKPSP